MDTPATPDAPGLLSTSVRGNILDLEHVWRDGDGPDSAFQPVPAHLSLVWQDGLPYWAGLTAEDRAALDGVNATIADLLTRQGTKLRWLTAEAGGVYPSVAPGLVPAYTLVGVPANVRPRYPRYGHTHKGSKNDHPPVRVRWPKVGWDGLRDFITEALPAEGVAAWAVSTPPPYATNGDYVAAVAVAVAPWFAAKSGAKNVATCVAKMDWFMFI